MRIITAIAALVFSAAVHASTWTSEITDMWWAPDQPGWGVNIVLQYDTAYATFFLYNQPGAPTWYTAALKFEKETASGDFIWSGPLYETRGAWYGAPYTPGSIRQAGTASFELPYLGQATLSYTVDGVEVLRIVNRQTWKSEDLSGSYIGANSIRNSSCTTSSLEGTRSYAATLEITHSGSALSVRATDAANKSCTYAGMYSQTGKLGEVIGLYSCTDGDRGRFDLYEITGNVSGFTARIEGESQSCRWAGFMGGTRHVR